MEPTETPVAGTGGESSEPLDEVQRSILWHLAQGKTWPQVARELALSEATMRRAVRRARADLGATSTVHAVYLAAKGGLI